MKIYLVGGAVRDALLGREITERDFVVVGASPDELLAKGFKPVGNDFPVFLHPQTHEEYALARTERKTAKGYGGFECFADSTVTLEQDLMRRDLTINAMAQEWQESKNGDASKKIIDPFHGQDDLQAKILRHVSLAFAEDPVRILRVARFSSRFPDFVVAPDTNQLMQKMVADGEVDALVPERVWKEFSRALTEAEPSRFFEVLTACGALPILFPEFSQSLSSTQHSCLEYLKRSLGNEISDSAHTQSSDNRDKALLRFGALSLGLEVAAINSLCQRLRPPTPFSELAFLVSKNLTAFQTLNIKDSIEIIHFLENLDSYRRPSRLIDFCRVAQLTLVDSTQDKRIAEVLKESFELTKVIDAVPFITNGLRGDEIGKAIHEARVEKLAGRLSSAD